MSKAKKIVLAAIMLACLLIFINSLSKSRTAERIVDVLNNYSLVNRIDIINSATGETTEITEKSDLERLKTELNPETTRDVGSVKNLKLSDEIAEVVFLIDGKKLFPKSFYCCFPAKTWTVLHSLGTNISLQLPANSI